MPIEGISQIVRLPRLGKIRLGVKVEVPGKNPYPKAVDYFVCPDPIKEVYGNKPKMLNIMFPVENEEVFAQQWLRAYSRTQGLICIGDGATCRSKIDTATGTLADHNTAEWKWVEGLGCNPEECPEYQRKYCRRVLNLQFLLPEVPGLGVWQIDSTSYNSIVNLNSMIRLVRGLCGRVAMIPLQLAIGPLEVQPLGEKKKTVYVMHINQDVRLADMQRLALVEPSRSLIPQPEMEEAPWDLYPELDNTDEPGETKTKTAPQTAPEREAPETATPLTLSEEQQAWTMMRELQSKAKMGDALILSDFRLNYPDLKGKLGKGTKLTDTVPEWVKIEWVEKLVARLKAYIDASKPTPSREEAEGAPGGTATKQQGSTERLDLWLAIRGGQFALGLTDEVLMSAFAKATPAQKDVIKGKITDVKVPPWASTEMLKGMVNKMQKALAPPKIEPEQPDPEAEPETPRLGITAPTEEPTTEPNPWDTIKNDGALGEQSGDPVETPGDPGEPGGGGEDAGPIALDDF